MFKIKELHDKLYNTLIQKTSPKEVILNSSIPYDEVAVGERYNKKEVEIANIEALSLLEEVLDGKVEVTDEVKTNLRKYKGHGGDDEYYTPKEVASAAWKLLNLNRGDKVLDPSAGVGVFAEVAPAVNLDQVELSSKSSSINKVVNPHATIQNKAFQYIEEKDNSYDAIITNVPFAPLRGELGNDKDNPLYENIKRVEEYFILKSLKLLKPSKRAVFIVPTGITNNKVTRTRPFKRRVLELGAFVGGFRLPNKIFSGAGADVATDILVFEKHPQEVLDRIENNRVPLKVLNDFFSSSYFYNGNYFEVNKDKVLGVEFSPKEIESSRFNEELLKRGSYAKRVVLTTKTIDEIYNQLDTLVYSANFKNLSDYEAIINSISDSDLARYNKIDTISSTLVEIDDIVRDKKEIHQSLFNSFVKEWRWLTINSKEGEVLTLLRKYKFIEGIVLFNATQEHKVKDVKRLYDIVKEAALFKNRWSKYYGLDDYPDKRLVQGHIRDYFGTLQKGKQIEVKKELGEVQYHKYLNFYDIPKPITREKVLESEDIFIDEEGNLIPAPKGVLYYDAVEMVENATKPPLAGFTDDDFEKKKKQMLEILERRKSTVPIGSLTLDSEFCQGFLGKDYFEDLKDIADNVYGYDIKDSILKRVFPLESFFYSADKKGGSQKILIKTFYRKDMFGEWGASTGLLEDLIGYEAAQEAYKAKESGNEKLKLEVFNKYAPIINEKFKEAKILFDVSFAEKVSLNSNLRNAIEEKLDKSSTLYDNTNIDTTEPLHNLKGLFTDEVIKTNHKFQNNDIRLYGQACKGIIGHDTGLGKTRTITGSMLYAIVTNNAKRGIIAVPNNAYGKWVNHLKEMLTPQALEMFSWTSNMSGSNPQKDYREFIKDKTKRCLVVPHSVFSDFSFMESTLEDLRGDTKIDGDKEVYRVNKIPEFSPNDWKLAFKSSASSIGIFEISDVDFVILDEGQEFKNSMSGGSGYKFASSLKGSRKGIVARVIKAITDKLVMATATPFTSSPYEIYSVLRTVGGLKNVDSLKQFESMYMSKYSVDEPLIIDPTRTRKITMFNGLKSLSLLYEDGLSTIKYRDKDSEQIESLKPEKEPIYSVSDSGEENFNAVIEKFKLFRDFADENNLKSVRENAKALIAVKYGITDEEEIIRKSSVFSQLRAFENLAISPELGVNNSLTLNIGHLTDAQRDKLITQLEKKKISITEEKEVVDKSGYVTIKEVKKTIVYGDLLKSKGLSLVDGDNLVLHEPTHDLYSIASSNKVTPSLDKFPKYKDLIENILGELTIDRNAKQLIYTNSLLGEKIIRDLVLNEIEKKHKFKNILVKEPTKKQEKEGVTWQDLYNKRTTSSILIFTKRNSTGVDFNIRTKAIHLLDVPYTPDELEQAEGRGIRQGNEFKSVKAYYYYTDNTLDYLKNEILDKKKDWQEELKKVNADNTSNIVSVQVDNKKVLEEALLIATKEGRSVTSEDTKKIIDRLTKNSLEAIELVNSSKVKLSREALIKSLYIKDKIDKGVVSRFDLELTNPKNLNSVMLDISDDKRYNLIKKALDEYIDNDKKITISTKEYLDIVNYIIPIALDVALTHPRIKSEDLNSQPLTMDRLKELMKFDEVVNFFRDLGSVDVKKAGDVILIHSEVYKNFSQQLYSGAEDGVKFLAVFYDEKYQSAIDKAVDKTATEVEDRISRVVNNDEIIEYHIENIRKMGKKEDIDFIESIKNGEMMFHGDNLVSKFDIVETKYVHRYNTKVVKVYLTPKKYILLAGSSKFKGEESLLSEELISIFKYKELDRVENIHDYYRLEEIEELRSGKYDKYAITREKY